MGMIGGGGLGLQSEINVTPLVDVVLVLLIIFMVIIPMTLHGYQVDIPTESTESVAPPEYASIVLAFNAGDCPITEPPAGTGLPEDCRVRLDDEQIAVSDLATRIGEIFEARPADQRVLFLAADEQLNYEGVLRVLDLAQTGVEGLRIGMVAEFSER